MSNDVIITVKLRNEVDFDQVREAGRRAGDDVTRGFDQARDSLGRFSKQSTETQRSTDGVTHGFDRARDSLGRFSKQNDQTQRSTDGITRGFDRARDSLGRFVKQGDGVTGVGRKMSDVDGIMAKLGALGSAFVGEFIKGLSGAAETAADFAARVGEVGFQMAASEAAGAAASSGLNLVQSALGALVTMVPAILAGFAALAPALLIAGGAAGAAATGFAAAGIGLATLAIGFGGIGDALTAHTKQMGKAGGAAKNTAEDQYQAAKRIHDAERSLVDAKNNEKDAAKAVNQARADEIDRLRELDLALRGQKISQAEAAQALIEAKEKARRANIAGSDWEKAEANNAVARAQLQYDSVTEKLGDLTAEKKKADKDGVEGSDQVQAALKRQTSAHEQVLRAQEQLADAHHKTAVAAAGAAGGVNLFDQAMRKLSPNAQKLVYALLDIEKRFDVIKRKVQDRLLAGFDTSVTDLADKWLPHLNDILGTTADHLNGFGKNLMKSLGDNEFIKNIERAGREGNKVIDKMSHAAGALVDAFGRLAGHSGPVLQVIARAIENIFVWFDKWIKAADKSGKLDSFMKTAADTLQKVFDIGGKAFKVVGQFIGIIFPDSQKAGNSVLDGISKALDSISTWLADPKNQTQIKQITSGIEKLITFIVKVGFPAVLGLAQLFVRVGAATVDLVNKILHVAGIIVSALSNAFRSSARTVADFFNWVSTSASKVGHGLTGMWDGLRNGFRAAVNWIIRGWNDLSFTIGGGSFLGMPIPSARFDTPNIPYLASGGIRGGMAMVGERGRELVRLPQGSSVIPNGTTERMLGEGGGAAHIILGFEKSSANRLMNAIIEGLQDYVKSRGGNVQVALGRHGAR